jgi:hypothetical protein
LNYEKNYNNNRKTANTDYTFCYDLFCITLFSMSNNSLSKATKKEINMPVDYKLQERILRYFIWGMGFFTFWSILFINFLFWLIR